LRNFGKGLIAEKSGRNLQDDDEGFMYDLSRLCQQVGPA